jgi:hypothetical protein
VAANDDGGIQDVKVVPLFPQQGQQTLAGLERGPTFDWQDPNALEREIQEVLRGAQPERATEAQSSHEPDPSHRNAVRCPQCDCFTWRRTRVCRNCGADLAAFASERRSAVLWCAAIASWGIALSCFYLIQHYALGPRIHGVLNMVGFGIVATNVFGFWIASQREKP